MENSLVEVVLDGIRDPFVVRLRVRDFRRWMCTDLVTRERYRDGVTRRAADRARRYFRGGWCVKAPDGTVVGCGQTGLCCVVEARE